MGRFFFGSNGVMSRGWLRKPRSMLRLTALLNYIPPSRFENETAYA